MRVTLYFLALILVSCNQSKKQEELPSASKEVIKVSSQSEVSLVVLGTLQDAGAPQLGCNKSCCARLYANPDPNLMVVSLGLIDYNNKQTYLFEATPDISRQINLLQQFSNQNKPQMPHGIFTTHAHIGHYTGLLFLGKEAINAPEVPVYAMPKMAAFLTENGPWSQLVTNKNIALKPLSAGNPTIINNQIRVTPLQVPHRDEFSETVGYIINGPNKSALFIPDIDKWERWEQDITKLIAQVDYAFLDATFYHGAELNTRDISQIPHPFIIESMERFKDLTPREKAKIHFIHFNHTNPVLNSTTQAYKTVLKHGFNIARPLQIIHL